MEHFILQLLKSHRGRIIVSSLAIAVCSIFSLFAWPNLSDARRLAARHATYLASVTDWKYHTGLHYFDGSYDLQYAFQLMPRGRWYVPMEKGPLARKELWSSLPKTEWQQAASSGRVKVAYCTDDPNISVLEHDIATNYRWIAGASVFLFIVLVSSLFWLFHLLLWGDPATHVLGAKPVYGVALKARATQKVKG